MNCERFQANLFEYLDNALPPDEKAAAQSHLRTCHACRQHVKNEQLVMQTLSGRLSEAVETATLDVNAQRRMADAVLRQIQNAPESKTPFSLPSWIRLAISAAALLLISAVWLGRGFIGQRHLQIGSSPGSAESEVRVYLSYSEPHYSFRQEGAMVIDALTSDTRVADGALLAKK
jgi:anti-sigma factor RsiW